MRAKAKDGQLWPNEDDLVRETTGVVWPVHLVRWAAGRVELECQGRAATDTRSQRSSSTQPYGRLTSPLPISNISGGERNGTVTREYFDLDQLKYEISPQGTVNYLYDPASRRTQLQVAGQTAVTYGYDNADRLTSIAQGATVVGFGYDDADRRTSLTLPGNLSLDYGYDDASQLLSITYKHSGSTIGDLAYTYDAVGRRATTSGSYARLNLPAAVTSAIYNANNQLTKWGSTNITYDLNGNMNGDGTNTYTWNSRDQLSAVTKSGQTLPSFTYDAFGRRRTKTLGAAITGYLYDGANIVQELTGGSPSANLLTGLGVDEFFQRTEGATTRTFLADALGSIVALADNAGVVQTSYTYAPYGETTVSGAASNDKSQYTSRENDSDGLYFYRARYYHPVFSRFVSEDPVGFAAGDPNLYGYVFENPVNYADPTGQLVPLLLAGLACGAGAIGGALSYAAVMKLSGRKASLGTALVIGAIGCGGALVGFFAGGVSLSSLALAASRPLLGPILALYIRAMLLANAITIAGGEARRAIDVLPNLVAKYGGPAADWVKQVQRGQLPIPFLDKALQLHWYYNRATGIIADPKINLIKLKR